ncbi:hypothetical protein LPA49_12965 [Pseudoalteromonas sp. MB41]|uniref:hypothetical protein n=1 Tax=Pseudoalteromonas sp. MB41 TaxID=2896366 RepID=UPI001E38ABFC|nr:hypothetical protein [Pseudoalteromonas sp. MB41]MCC9661463.1 hypothetical protein [Pseudoalteromonas sp. MB41]
MELNSISEHFEAIKASFIEDLQPIASPDSRKGHDYYGYFSYELLTFLDDVTPENIHDFYHSTKNDNIWKLEQNRIFELLGVAISSNGEKGFLRIIFASLFASIAKKKVVVIPADYYFNKPFTKPHKQFLSDNYFISLLPSFAKELLLTATRSRFEQSKHSFINDWAGVEENFNHYKTWNKSAIDVFNLFCAYGIEKPTGLSPEIVNNYRVDRLRCNQGVMSWLPAISFFDHKFDTAIVSKTQELARRQLKIEIKKDEKTTLDYDDSKFKSLGPKEALESSSPYLKGKDLCVLAPRALRNDIKIGEYTFHISSLANYNISSIDKSSLWYKSQEDYVGHDSPEKSTKNQRINALRYLNAYLFDYLPYFFSKNDTVIQYPDTPEKFLGYIFIKPSSVMESVAFKSEQKIIYPCSFIDFTSLFVDMRKLHSTDNNNTLRDTLATINRYFEYILTNFGNIDGLKLQSNPLDANKKKFGSRYSKSNKAMLDLNYWIYFRAFIKTLTKHAMLKSAEECYLYCKKNGLNEIAADIKVIKEDISDFIDKTETSLSEQEVSNRIPVEGHLPISKVIELVEGYRPLKIFDVDLSKFKRKSIQLTEMGLMCKHLDYQSFASILVSAYAAQRASNASWLDADNFDADYIQDNNLPMESLVDIRIHTDKSKPTGFESLISREVMEVLLLARKLRGLNRNPNYVNPIKYQDNEQSKFGKLKPLLQNSNSNSFRHYNLSLFLEIFEKCLTDSGIEFVSQLRFGPVNVRSQDFYYFARLGSVPVSYSYYIRDNQKEDFVPFSSIEYKSLITVHSLRKQLVTVFDVLIGDREAIGMITGQSEATVGYYSDSSPQIEGEIVKHKKLVIESVVAPEAVAFKEDDFEQTIDYREFAKKYRPITTHMTKEVGSGLYDLSSKDELSLNWTHLCPFGNDCPNEVVRTIGRMNCHICPKAISTKHQAPAIALKIKKLLDDVADLTAQKFKANVTSADLDSINYEITNNLKQASCWKVRIDIINKYGIAVGDKDEVVNRMKYMVPGTFKHSLWLRLKEAANTPILQSDKLKRISNRMVRKLNKVVPELAEILESIEGEVEDDPVSFLLTSLQMVSEIKEIPLDELLDGREKLISDDNKKLLEILNV